MPWWTLGVLFLVLSCVEGFRVGRLFGSLGDVSSPSQRRPSRPSQSALSAELQPSTKATLLPGIGTEMNPITMETLTKAETLEEEWRDYLDFFTKKMKEWKQWKSKKTHDEIIPLLEADPEVVNERVKKYAADLELGPDQLLQTVMKRPQNLWMDLAAKRKEWEALGFSPEAALHALRKWPTLAERNMERVIKEFAEVGFTMDDMDKFALRRPQILLKGKPEVCQRHLKYWMGEELGKQTLLKWPHVLCFNYTRNIKPKFLFLENVMKKKSTEVASYPKFLTMSLRGRIQPRWQILLDQ
uniref:Uncharacterized protein n=1 Tax=Chromera velia CCMP2878 TaxID=1169474 RepID=A0A0G4GJW5_9ALVE|eukprot:Cvel_22228.t1-p1 / transcript=Cvel_22228.t1 / gene=Cvel_22228 / organism=Chromera_velia_CCMP2878 / gene_product=hypothetical protein / transcript_product=hypothetical protein / location=Cvel_scaffold2163:242-1135(-) / protein_length=298 / sequence_SO=supercontig / SO=protein_coding / is_pseudo=false